MLEHSARVVRIEGGITYVVARRDSSCGSCNTHGECGTLTLTRFFGGEHPFRVRNPVDAQPGDDVIIGVQDGALGRSALLMYGIPLLLILLSAFGLSYFAPDDKQLDAYAAAGGLLGLLLAAGWVVLAGRITGLSGEFEPVILQRQADVSLTSHKVQWRK